MTTPLDVLSPIQEYGLPKDWRLARLDEICEFLDSRRVPVNNTERVKRIAGKPGSELFPYYGANGQVGMIDSYLFDEPLILLAEDGGAFGSQETPIAYAIRGKSWVNNHAHVLRPRHGVDFDYCLNALRIRPDVGALVSGSTRAKLNQAVAASILVPLPPLPEQQRIASLLTQKMAAVDAARVAAEAQLAAAKALPATYLQTMFDGAEAREWPKIRLGDVLALRKDIVHPRDLPTGETTFVGLEHVASGTGLRTGSLSVNMAHLTGRKPRFFHGDLVYGYLRPYLNKVWIAEFDGLCSVDQYVYRVASDRADTEFVAWFMRSPVYLGRAPIDTTPGQLPRIRTEEVAAVGLNLPPLAVQKEVVARLNSQLRTAGAVSLAVREQRDTISLMPPALLREAFSGRL